jgi:hypothetical protein
VEELIPILPLAKTFKIDVPDDDAMLNMSLLPAVPCKLKVTVEEEALTPKTLPLSIKVDVARVVELSQRVA